MTKENVVKLLSLCVPTYNRVGLLHICLDSIILNLKKFSSDQLANIELVITDNCSDDGTQEYILEFIKQHSELDVRYLRHDKNLGMSGNWNSFLHFAEGKYIVWYPDDDILPDNDHLIKAYKILTEHDDIQMVFGHQIRGYCDTDSPEIKTSKEDKYNLPEVVSNKFIIANFWNGFYPNYAVFNRLDILSVGGFPPSVALDMEMIFRLMIKFPEKVNYYTGEPGAIWRLHSSSESEVFFYNEEKKRSFIDSMQKVYLYAMENLYPDIEYIRKHLQRMLFDYIFILIKRDRKNLSMLSYTSSGQSFTAMPYISFGVYIWKRAFNKLMKIFGIYKDNSETIISERVTIHNFRGING